MEEPPQLEHRQAEAAGDVPVVLAHEREQLAAAGAPIMGGFSTSSIVATVPTNAREELPGDKLTPPGEPTIRPRVP